MGALLQVLLRVLPAPSHDSDTEVEVDAHYACACCGDVRVDENAHQNKDHLQDDDSSGMDR